MPSATFHIPHPTTRILLAFILTVCTCVIAPARADSGDAAAQPVAPMAKPGAGYFEKHSIDDSLPTISAVAVDVDGDGKLDVVAAVGVDGQHAEGTNQVVWYRAPHWGRLPVVTLGPKSVVTQLEAVDLLTRRSLHGPGGRAQVIATDAALGQVWWLRAQFAGKAWDSSIVVDHVPGAQSVAVGDIDGDGWDDLLVPTQNGDPPHGLIWARNPGPHGRQASLWQCFPLATSFNLAGWQQRVGLADLLHEGKPAALLASAGEPGWVGYWTPGADPRGAWQPHRLDGPMRGVTNLVAADLNGDGRPGLVGSEGHGRCLWWFPPPDFKPVLLADDLPDAHALAIGDFDGDGRLDIATCSNGLQHLVVFFNRGGGKFKRVLIDDKQAAMDIRAVDLKGDGAMDLLVAGGPSNNLVWYESLTKRGK